MTVAFDYGFARVCDLEVQTEETRSDKSRVKAVVVNDEPLKPTPRFWKSFFMRFGISENVFRYFSHEEVLDRISQRTRKDQVRYCVERDGQGNGKLLAVSNPDRPVITHDQISSLIHRYEGSDVSYASGIVTSTHVPRSGHGAVKVGADDFKHRYVLDAPIDGFGQPKIHLSFLRLLCANGMVGYSRAFRSEVSVGKDVGYCIARALESFDNEEGYAALRQRFHSAQQSWASIHECEHLYKILQTQWNAGQIPSTTVLRDFQQMTGNLHELYGLANLNALSVKRRRVLPARCRVYDLLNFASEVATHHARAGGGRSLQAYLGQLISDEYDMEGTAADGGDFQDFFVAGDAGQMPLSRN